MRRLFEARPTFFLLLAAILPWGCSILGPDEGPDAAFQAATRSGTAPLEVQFTDQSSAGGSPITERTWWFGDGAKSSERNPVHVYQAAGTYDVALLIGTKVGNDTEVKAGFIVVSPPSGPTAEFVGTPRSGQKPLTVQFTDQSNPGSGTITSWSWSFGDGATSTSKDPSHVYGSDGTYAVSLTVQTAVGSNTKAKPGYITVSAAPVAAFTGAPRNGTTPLDVQFTDESLPGTSPITSWAWSFGDGGTSTVQNPTHTYATAGSYSVSLTVTTADGTDAEDKAGYVVVTDPTLPTAAFSGSPRAGIRPLAVQFTDQSTPGTFAITAWSWTFGDGGTSTSQNPTHTYAAAGTYAVALTVTTSAGSDTDTQAGYVVVSNPVPPTAAFSGSPRTGVTPLVVQFTDQSTPGTFPITAWSWSFGDGGTSTSQNPTHTYAAAGTYAVALTVTTSAGNDTDTQAGYVVASAPVPPTAGFSGSPRNGAIPLAVQFTDQSTAGTSPITAWSWSFGDGATSTAQNPSHTYNAAGSFDVSLTVTTSVASDGDSKSAYVVATQPPVADFEGTPRAGDRPLAVQFTDLSAAGSAPITAWSWTFGDGGTSTAQNPAHTYTVAGTYAVGLTVTTADGSDAATKPAYVTVTEPPVPPTADFSGAPTAGPAPLAVQFTDLSSPGTAPIASWLWSFGDGGTSTAQSPGHTYLGPGTYDVSLAVMTADGTDTATKTGYVTVCPPPTADFSAAPTTGVAPLTVQFTDLSIAGEGSIASWSWAFGDGGTSTEQSPAHDYATPGVYPVSLTVSDACGTDTETKSGYVTVQDPCDAATYSIADAFVEVRADADGDGCAERARVHFDANVEAGCSRSVFAKVFLRPEGATAWTVELPSACYTIAGATTADDNWIQVINLPLNFYEIRVELYECGGTVPVAARDYLDDADLDNRCFE